MGPEGDRVEHHAVPAYKLRLETVQTHLQSVFNDQSIQVQVRVPSGSVGVSLEAPREAK